MKLSPGWWWRYWREPWRREAMRNGLRWRRHGDRDRLRQFPSVGPGDAVLDFGGFRGEWASLVRARTGARVHVFEPHPRFAEGLRRRFAGDPGVIIHEVALGRSERPLILADIGDASTARLDGVRQVKGRMVEAGPWLEQLGETRFAMAKVNIEGGEYELLPALAGSGWLERIGILRIQFHLYEPRDRERREAIRRRLAETHVEGWCVPWVWEEWHRPARLDAPGVGATVIGAPRSVG